MDRVNKVVLVKSVKGGVGKSTVSTQIALALVESGFKVILLHSIKSFANWINLVSFQVGLLDVDLCGPSVAYLLDVEDRSG